MNALPDLPTIAESGLKFSVAGWYNLSAPKGTPPDVLKKLNDALKVALKDPDFIKKQEGLGAVLVTDKRVEPAEHKKFVATEIAKWTPIIKAAGIDRLIATVIMSQVRLLRATLHFVERGEVEEPPVNAVEDDEEEDEVDVAVGGIEAAVAAIGGGAPAVVVTSVSTATRASSRRRKPSGVRPTSITFRGSSSRTRWIRSARTSTTASATWLSVSA